MSREQIDALKAMVRAHIRHPGKLRLVACAAILAVGFLGYVRPQAQRLANARAHLDEWEEQARLSTELRHCVEQAAVYTKRLPATEDVAGWQNYVMDKLRLSGARLRNLEPLEVQAQESFLLVVLELEAEGRYGQIVDFVDRLERGERVLRLDDLGFEKRRTHLVFTCTVAGLVKVRDPEAAHE